MKTVICWMRRDLRLHDHAALSRAAEMADIVIPVFIFDPNILSATTTGAPTTAYMFKVLESLSADIKAAGGTLVFRYGNPVEELRKLILETNAKGVFFNRDYEPAALTRDAEVIDMAATIAVPAYSCNDLMYFEPEEVLNRRKEPFTVFTPYSRDWHAKFLSRPPVTLPAVTFRKPLAPVASFPITLSEIFPNGTNVPLPPAGEASARSRLNAYISGPADRYATARDLPYLDGTSRLSPDLRFGTISTRHVLKTVSDQISATPEASEDLGVFIKELVWRDFYRQILFHFPRVATESFQPKCNGIAWSTNTDHFQAWCEGRTGFPIVDAGMRQLNQTGWMHNRLRMITASFLTKDLHISWQWGERYFMQKLIDADLSANNGGWQWSASTGTDAQPYFRVFNPTLQTKRFDPEGRFIEKYVPEANLLTYQPIVDHMQQKAKAIALFRDL